MSRRHRKDRTFVAPPIPPPYLAKVSTWLADQLSALDSRAGNPSAKTKAAARQKLTDLVQLVRQARTRYEATAGVIIIAERPPMF